MMKLLLDRKIKPEMVERLRNRGNGYIKKNLKKFLDAAHNKRNVFVLTDLDAVGCAPALLKQWLGLSKQPPSFSLRIAVREVEAWLLADREALAEFLGISPQKIQTNIEAIAKPKEYLLQIAQKAKPNIRKEILPVKGALALQGFGYNDVLCEFVIKHWHPQRASQNAPSLARALRCLDARASDIISSSRVH